jgi:hypothetical protein
VSAWRSTSAAAWCPSRHVVEAAIARENRPTFATAVYNEPRDWGYAGLLAFTTVLMTRPQDTLPFLNPFHLAELCAIVGIAPMVMHRLTSRQPVFRVTPETTGLLALGAAILFTTPFSIWPGGSFGLFTDSYLKLLVVFVLMMNTLTTPRRIEQITWVIVLCCGFIAGRSVFDYARGVNLVEGNRLAGAIGGIFGNPNDLAMNMVTFLPAAAVVALSKRYAPSKRMLAALASALMLATVVFTKSRGGFLGLAAGAAHACVPGAERAARLRNDGHRGGAVRDALHAVDILGAHGQHRRRPEGQGGVHRHP